MPCQEAWQFLKGTAFTRTFSNYCHTALRNADCWLDEELLLPVMHLEAEQISFRYA